MLINIIINWISQSILDFLKSNYDWVFGSDISPSELQVLKRSKFNSIDSWVDSHQDALDGLQKRMSRNSLNEVYNFVSGKKGKARLQIIFFSKILNESLILFL